jgi:hypothetical protein
MPSVKADRIIDQWATIVELAAGKGEHIYTVLDTELTKANTPQVTWSRGDVNTGLMTKGREFFIIKNAGLREYTMYVYARDVGAHLDCGWFLTVEPGFLKKTFSKHMTGNPIALSQSLGVFSQQDLSAWTHIVHRTFLRLVKDLMGDMDQDISGMNTTSKGFLSVW